VQIFGSEPEKGVFVLDGLVEGLGRVRGVVVSVEMIAGYCTR
jgi:hypothetical protein